MTKKVEEIKELLDVNELEELRREVVLSVVDDRVDPQVIIEAMLKKLADKKNPLVFFQDKDAQLAIGQLGASGQGEVWIKIKELCPGINLVQAKRAVKEAVAKVKRDMAGNMPARGLIQSNGAYYIERQTANGPIITQISNFVIEPVQKLVMPDGRELVKVLVHINGNQPFEKVLSAVDFLGRKEFLKAIGSVSVQWTGNDLSIQQLLGHMANIDVPVKYGVPFIGWHKGRFITPGAVITAEGREDNSNFVYIPQGTAFEQHINFPECYDWPGLSKFILERLPYLQPERVIWPVIGWIFACPVSVLIRQKYNEFPILHNHGTAGSGKTSIVQVLLNMLGVMAEPYSAAGKEFVILRSLSVTNALPMFFDEYRPQAMDPKRLKAFHEKLLLCYRASIDSRGRPDQRTVEYKLMAPVVLAGEAPLPEAETGLMERVIQVRYDRNFVDNSPLAQEKFDELVGLPLVEFAAGYIAWLMGWDIPETYDTALAQVDKYLVGLKVAARVRHNLAAVLTGIILFRKLAEEVGAEVPRNNLRAVFRQLAGEDPEDRREPQNALDRFMLHLEGMVHSGEIRRNEDFVLREDENPPKLVIYTNPVIAAARKYCKTRGLEGELINDKALRGMLEEKISDYVLEPYGHRARIGNQNVRTTVINAQRLEEVLGVSIDVWRPRGGTSWNANKEGSFIKNIDNSTVLEEEPF